MNQSTSMGSCLLCDGSFSRAEMTRHLKTCGVDEPSKQPLNKSFHLFVEGRYSPVYWLHFAAGAEASLRDVDSYLRAIWLECCGHSSAFKIQGKRYCYPFVEAGLEIGISGLLQPGKLCYYEYDFGSTTALKLKLLGMRDGSPDSYEVRLLARNDAPHVICDQCGIHQATKICMQCQSSGRGWLCEACTASHRCGPDVYLPVSNSPRAGVCGYS